MSKKKENDDAGADDEFSIKARVLVDTTVRGKTYLSNDVGLFSKHEIEAYEGVLDSHPASVEYAESLQ